MARKKYTAEFGLVYDFAWDNGENHNVRIDGKPTVPDWAVR